MKPVLDTNVLLHGRGSEYSEVYLIQEVVDEVKSERGKNYLRNLDYEVHEPSKPVVQKVGEKSDEINSPTSEADEKLLALALDRGETLVTDDKPLQNLALHLDADFEGFLDEPTDQKFEWKKICKGCGIEASGSSCPRCGSQVRRKQVSCSSE